jgi:hypothetical protein
MRHYLPVEGQIQAAFKQQMALSEAQTRRIANLCVALMLAGEVQLSRLARYLNQAGQQASRIKWIKRLLGARYLTQELAYQGLLKYSLGFYKAARWHVVIDRTTLNGQQRDIVAVSLNYHKRAVPLVWCFVPFGGAGEQIYCALLRRCAALLPSGAAVVLHGDTEFGSSAIIQLARQLGWNFILAQKCSTHFWRPQATRSEAFEGLPVTARRSYQLANIALGHKQRLDGLNLLAFWSPHYSGGHQRREVAYLVTSLPLSRSLKRLGRRRWGIEPFFRDFKSAGWRMFHTALTSLQRLEGLFVIMALTYLWMVCLGRWLCKTGQRRTIDAYPHRHFSLFRLGWDWLVHAFRIHLPVPITLRLYL